MNVNFNNLRKQAVHVMDQLTDSLNDAIIKNDDQYAVPNAVYHGQQMNIKGYVLIDADSIQNRMDDLRSLIGSIAMTYREGDEDFKDIFAEMFPGEECMKSFNNEENE